MLGSRQPAVLPVALRVHCSGGIRGLLLGIGGAEAVHEHLEGTWR